MIPDETEPDETETDETETDETEGRSPRVEERALLLPEERAAGSDDPEAQASAILADSDRREFEPERTQQASPQSPDLDD
jgi:hypothetical protein